MCYPSTSRGRRWLKLGPYYKPYSCSISLPLASTERIKQGLEAASESQHRLIHCLVATAGGEVHSLEVAKEVSQVSPKLVDWDLEEVASTSGLPFHLSLEVEHVLEDTNHL